MKKILLIVFSSLVFAVGAQAGFWPAAPQPGGSGTVIGPGTVTADVSVCFNGTTGNLLKECTETGTGANVLGTSPTITTPLLTLQDGNAAAPTTDGRIKYDRTTERLQVGDGASTTEFYGGVINDLPPRTTYDSTDEYELQATGGGTRYKQTGAVLNTPATQALYMLGAFLNNSFFETHEFEVLVDTGVIYAEVWSTLQTYNAGTTYNRGNQVLYSSMRYYSIVDSNTGNQPDTSPTEWALISAADLNMHGFIDGSSVVFTLDTTTGAGVSGHARVALTAGTDANPTKNWIYAEMDGSTDLDFSSSTTKPTTPVIILGTVVVGSVATTNTQGPVNQHRFTNGFYKESLFEGQAEALRRKVRARVAYDSGVDPTLTVTANGGSLDNVVLTTTEGLTSHLWQQIFPAQSGTPTIYCLNHPTNDITTQYTDFNEFDVDANNVTMRLNSSRYGLRVYGNQTSGTNDTPALYVMLPNGSYANDQNALNDVEPYDVTTIPDDFIGTLFNIGRVVLRYQTGASGTLTNLVGGTSIQNKRGELLGAVGGAGGAISSQTEFSDAEYLLYNSSDSTKQIDWDLSGIATGTKRTITMPDSDVSLYTPGFTRDIQTQLSPIIPILLDEATGDERAFTVFSKVDKLTSGDSDLLFGSVWLADAPDDNYLLRLGVNTDDTVGTHIDRVVIEVTGAMTLTTTVTSNGKIFQLGSPAKADAFNIDEDGDVEAAGSITATSQIYAEGSASSSQASKGQFSDNGVRFGKDLDVTIQNQAKTNDTATQSLSDKGQDAWGSASTNKGGGDRNISSGASIAGGTDGDININADTGAGTPGDVIITGNNFSVDAAGVLTVAPYERHIAISAGAALLGPTAPDVVTYNSVVRCLEFDHDDEEAFLDRELPEDWVGSEDMGLAIIWFPNDSAMADGNTVKFDIQLKVTAEGADHDGTLTSATATHTDSGGATLQGLAVHTTITLDYDDGNNPLVKQSHIDIQVTRDMTGDSYGDGACIKGFKLNYNSNTLPHM